MTVKKGAVAVVVLTRTVLPLPANVLMVPLATTWRAWGGYCTAAPALPGSPSPTLRIVIVPGSAMKMPPWPSSDTPVTVHILTAKPGRQRARTHCGVSLSLSSLSMWRTRSGTHQKRQ